MLRPHPWPETSARSPDRAGAPVRFRDAWLLSVEEHGEYLIIERDRVVIGNAVAGVADLPVLANIASRHAVISRRDQLSRRRRIPRRIHRREVGPGQ